MGLPFRRILSAFSTILLMSSLGFAANYDEGVDGDLSGDRLNPTSLSLALGSNTVTATSVSGDLEYLTINIPAGLQLTTAILSSYLSDDDRSFMAIQSGNVFTEPPAANIANLLGWVHFGTGPGQVGTDILDDLGSAPGAIGFTPPLPGGDYTFWMQEGDIMPATYTVDLVVTPEPVGLVLFSFGSIMALRRREQNPS
jgi:hypothetical protein